MTHDRSPHRSLRRSLATLAALGLLLALGLWLWGRRTEVVFEGESISGRVRVVERADGLRSLYMGEGRARQSAVFPGRPRHLELAYSRVAMVGLALAPHDGRFLFVGLGGGAMPMYARSVLPDARIEAVELDPMIVDVARRYFGLRPDSRLVVHTGDGRAFIESAPPASYDLIVLDAFSDDEVPFALTTREFLEAVGASLAPGGVVVSNLWSAGREYRSMLATYRAVFPEVHLLRVRGRAQRILVAAPGEGRLGRSTLVAASRDLARRVELGFDLPGLVAGGYEGRPRGEAPLLVDRREGGVPAP